MGNLELSPRRILLDDAGLLGIDKPAGLVVHQTLDPGRDHLVAAVTRFLAARDGQQGRRPEGHLALMHRLDAPTSGVVLFSRQQSLDAPLSAAFASREMDKEYLAIVRERPDAPFPDGAVLRRDYLAPGKGPGGRTLVVNSGGQPAETTLCALHRTGDLVLVRAQPRTGRTHQIRVHLAALGFPIVGDALYGGNEANAKRLMLHAFRLGLGHPLDGKRLSICAPLPRAFTTRFPAAVADPSLAKHSEFPRS